MTECSSGEECRDGSCVDRCADPEACAPLCEPGSTTCSSNRASVRTCSSDGAFLAEVECGAGNVCVEGTPTECKPVVCAANTLGCLDDETAYVCDGTGTARSSLPCGAARYCDAGTCRDEVCDPGTTICEGQSIVTCDARGSSAAVRACSSEPACAASTFGCGCSDGECEVRACAPESTRCVANSTQRCSADGLTWGALTDCGASSVCVGGSCVPKTCTPGSRECVGDTLVECNASGTSRTETDCKTSLDICTGTGAAAACTDRVCTPNATTCNATTSAVLLCDARGAAQTTVSCGAGQYCDGGVCRAQVCEPSSVTCDGSAVVTCNVLGSASTVRQCASDPSCAGGLYGCTCSSGTCVSRICSPGSTRCAGNGTQTCSSDGLYWGSQVSCGNTHVCVAGACELRVCSAGGRACEGETLVVCNATGTAEARTDCQASQLSCSESDGSAACVDTTTCGSLVLDGTDDFAEAPSLLGYAWGSSLTAEAWVNWSAKGQYRYEDIMRSGNETTTAFVVTIAGQVDPNPTCQGGSEVGRVMVVFGGSCLQTPEPIPSGAWHHIAVTFGASKLTLFVDGELVATGPGPTTLPSSPTALGVGRNFHNNFRFGGSIDEVRVSRTVRYTGAFSPAAYHTPDADTIGLWHMDEGAGSTVSDESGHGYTLNVSGATWATQSFDCP